MKRRVTKKTQHELIITLDELVALARSKNVPVPHGLDNLSLAVKNSGVPSEQGVLLLWESVETETVET